MGLKDDFVGQAKKKNPGLSSRSSLQPLITVLEGIPTPPPGMPAVPTDPQRRAMAEAVGKLPPSKRTRYDEALRWLDGRIAEAGS